MNYQDYYNLRGDKALSNFDIRHRFVGSMSWELPFGNGRKFLQEGVLAKVVGGFTLNAITQAQGGLPLLISAVNDALQGLAFIALRPNLAADPQSSADSTAGKILQYFNTAAFQQPANYTIGNAPRTLSSLRGPNYVTTSFSISRDFKFTEKAKLQFRAEAFNAFNRANFATPGTTLGLANFGVITNTEDPRQVQFAARLYF